ncbi:hypothetical protein [Chryseobacterium scophthalmum]|uniref:hypothetical protein n=1 Tax=Chryseobacterium scophthalmum TaxID=59733 RepID=UPI003CFF3511
MKELSIQLKTVADYYFTFLKKIEILTDNVLMKEFICYYDRSEVYGHETTVDRIFQKLNQEKPFYDNLFPIHLRYTDQLYLHLVVGIVHEVEKENGYLHAIDLCLPKKLIKNVPSNVMYVGDILDSYHNYGNQTVKEFIEGKGYNYSHFQRDCKICFGDAFYRFQIKKNMMNAVGDIIFTELSLKEIAFKNNFLDYANMYKAFLRHDLNITTIPRLGNL